MKGCDLDPCDGLRPDGTCPYGFGVTCEARVLEPEDVGFTLAPPLDGDPRFGPGGYPLFLVGPERSEGPTLSTQETRESGASPTATGDNPCKSPLSDPPEPLPVPRGNPLRRKLDGGGGR
jgi:hypothetical protein